ncbi:MAG: class II aldolase/adducin family protein, partial [Desulfobacterales bacterium]|nr:class II aldolase/adducin family protein [Desulfobacterales bacterium]
FEYRNVFLTTTINAGCMVANNRYCYILQNHGALNLGRDIDHAWKNTELLEKVSQIYYAALITGKDISTLPKESIDYFNKMREST